MYKRDVAILLMSCVAILVSLQREGSFSFQKAWYHQISNDVDELFASHHALPLPVVADLNGDGNLEVVVATPDLRLQVIQPQPAGHAGEGFAAATLIHQVSLMYQRIAIPAVQRPVALQVGYLDPPLRERVRAPRKMVIVLVTAAWHVMVFDHNLRLMWEHSIHEGFPPHSHLKEAAIHISHHKVNEGDRGLIVVGGSAIRGDLGSGMGLQYEMEGLGDDSDVLRRQMRDEEMGFEHHKSAGSGDEQVDVEEGHGADMSRHFSYYGFEGAHGEERWHHAAQDFHRSLENDAGEMRPQNDYRLEAQELESRHFGELSCRDYRESVLHVLPHAWTRMTDTRLEAAVFMRHREGKGADKKALAGGHKKKGKTPPPAHSYFWRLFGVGSKAVDPVAHSGLSRSTVTRHTPGVASHGADTFSNVSANALVAYLEEGIEVIHLYTGRTLCKLHLPPSEVHADINGDGMVDHIQVMTGAVNVDEAAAAGGEVNAHTRGTGGSGRCKSTIRSGIPPRETLFEVNVCRTRRFFGGKGNNALRQPGSQLAREILPPALLPIPRQSGGYGEVHGRRVLLAYLTNFGEITAVSPAGDRLWQGFFAASWPAGDSGESMYQVVPTMAALPLRRHAYPTALLAAGSTTAVIISEHGNVMDSFSLPAPPVAPLIVDDFNGDGLNDIMLLTASGLYGYAQVPHLGGFALSAILLTLIIAMGVVYYSQQFAAGFSARDSADRKLRSTDYVD